jgi:hypothetical protein
MRFPYVVLLSACALMLALPLLAQSPNGVLNGLVVDPTNRAIVQADVVAVNDLTGIQYPTKTNDEGIYVLRNLPPGPYRLQVSKVGFKTLIKPDITIKVQDALAINFTLPIGALSETVTVEGGAPLVNTESATVSTVVDRQFAENLPLNGRSFQTLIQLTPGVVLTQVASGDEGQFSVNGQRAASNYWMVDGVSANFGVGNASSGQGEGVGGALPAFGVQGGTNSLVSVDALQEFRIQTSTYAPEFGRTPGGQISIVTRSGTNQFHGTAFDYLRNDLFDANNWFAGLTSPPQPKPEERQNDFGGTLGGPILKGKTFFFFSYEGLRLRLPTVGNVGVPTVAARQAAVAATQPLLNAFPLPNGTDFGNGSAQFLKSFSNASSLDATSLRVDHTVNDKVTLFGRYNYSPSSIDSRIFGLADIQTIKSTVQTTTAGITWAFSPAITNELRINYSRLKADVACHLDDFGGAVPLTASQLNFPTSFSAKDALLEAEIIDPFELLLVGHNGGSLQRQINIVDNLSVQKQAHSLKFGIDYRRLAPTFDPRSYLSLPVFLDMTSAQNADLAENLVFASRRASLKLQNLSAFAQDTWRLNSRLTLTYGLRWDLDFVPNSTPAYLSFTNFNRNDLSGVGFSSSQSSPYSMTYGNLAPRFGAAYQVGQKKGWEQVVRGGFGVFFDLATQEQGNLLTSSQYPFGALKFAFGPVFGGTATYPLSPADAAPPVISIDSVATSGAVGYDPKLKLPYTLQWNFAFEQSLGSNRSLSATYVGSVGRRLLQMGDVVSPNDTFGQIQFVTNAATSDYHALQLQFQQRVTRGLQALGAYTWAHSIDSASAGSVTGSNFGNTFVPGIDPQGERGASDFDIRNAFSIGFTYALPGPHTNSVAAELATGWSIQSVVQARSAPPVNVYYSDFSQESNAFNADIAIRPDLNPSVPLYLHGPQYPGGRALNSTPDQGGSGCIGPFCPPPLDPNGNPLQGNLSRNALRGFGATQWDFAVHRQFSLPGSLKLQFRAEMFNVLNHPNFAPPIGDLNDSQFGQSTAMLGRSLAGGAGTGGFSSLYQVGGPRSIQFALKLQF